MKNCVNWFAHRCNVDLRGLIGGIVEEYAVVLELFPTLVSYYPLYSHHVDIVTAMIDAQIEAAQIDRGFFFVML